MKGFFTDLLKSKNRARKATAIVVIITAVLLIAALLALIVSSVVFALRNGEEDQPDDDINNEVPAPEIEYTTIEAFTSDQLSLGSTVSIKEARTEHPAGGDNHYYASYNVSVLSAVQKRLDAMLVANYNANKSSMVSDTKDDACNLPVIKSADMGGRRITIVSYDEENAYSTPWLTNNATKYGFIQDGNTFTYVGVPHAAYMAKNGIKNIDDYVEKLAAGTVKISAVDASKGTSASYEVYHIAKGSELSVPSNFAYSVIEDGADGYIIAVNLSKVIS